MKLINTGISSGLIGFLVAQEIANSGQERTTVMAITYGSVLITAGIFALAASIRALGETKPPIGENTDVGVK